MVSISDGEIEEIHKEPSLSFSVVNKDFERASTGVTRMNAENIKFPEVLIVDDTEFNRYALRTVLEKLGVKV